MSIADTPSPRARHRSSGGRSEALEHRLEHIVIRKPEAIDFRIRARGRP